MTDERLVSISGYADQEEAEGELAKLRDAGLTPALKADYGRYDQPVEILVPESQYERARGVLGIVDEAPPETDAGGISPPPSPTPTIVICPECHGSDTFAVPSYAGRAFLASLVILAISAVFGKAWIGAIAICLGWVVAIFLSRHTGKWRCRTCGWEFAPENA